MKILSELLCSIWSITLLVLLNVASPVGVSGMSISTIVYGEQIQLSNTYDEVSAVVYNSVGKSLLRYDADPALTTGEKKNGMTENRIFFAEFSEFLAAKGVAPRALTQADLGVKGTLQELKGTFAVKDDVAQVRVDMIRGDIQNPFQVIKNLSETAKAQGASTLRIEATLANEKLYNVLVRRYGLVTEGSKDIITIPIR